MYLFSGVPALAGLQALAPRTAPAPGAGREAHAVPAPLARAVAHAPLAERGWREPGAAALTHRHTPGVLAIRARRGCLVVSGDVLGAGPVSRVHLVDEVRALARAGAREVVATGLDPDAAHAWRRLGFRTARSGASITVEFAAADAETPPGETREPEGIGGPCPAGDATRLEVLPTSWEAPLRERLSGVVPQRALGALVAGGPGAGSVVLVRRRRRLVAVGRIWQEGGEQAVHLYWCRRGRGVVAGAAAALVQRARTEGADRVSVHLHRRLGWGEERRIPVPGVEVTPRFTARSPGLSGILAARLA